MDARKRTALRASIRIREQLGRFGWRRFDFAPLETAWTECRRLIRQWTKARRRSWYFAARRLENQLAYTASKCRFCLEQIELELQQADPEEKLAGSRDIFQDLLALEKEFAAVEIDLRRAQVSVTTEEILLDGLNLGPFRIVFSWEGVDEELSYEVVALQPNPSVPNPSVTHPHVHSNRLCEGDGRRAVRLALRGGRLLDFFLLVRQILSHYHSPAAYVALEQWNAIPCRDCGELTSRQDRHTCAGCEATVCSDCVATCRRCDQDCCSQCVGVCSSCRKLLCSECVEPCYHCSELFCQECLSHDACSNCRGGGGREEQGRQDVIPAEAGR
ncbi:MAG TPA: hypothetical protein EYH34_04635 [Planctomycetes bacterium]|nr:hypothetical protein [Planctomycetota bacterium]